MLFYLRHLIRALAAAARSSHPRRPYRVRVLTHWLRAALGESVRRDAAWIRGLEVPVPLAPALRRRLALGHTEVAGIDALSVAPRKAEPRGLLLYFHGGWLQLLLDQDSSRAPLPSLSCLRCALCGAELSTRPREPVSPPRSKTRWRFTGPLPEAFATSDRFWIGGDSAGGGLALATLLRLREDGDELPRGAVLLSPWSDLTVSGESIVHNAPHDYLSDELLRFFARNYLGETPPATPLVSPLYADLQGLPPLLIQLGGAEVLLSEGKMLAERARKAGVDVTLQIWDDAIHAFQIFAPIIPEARAALGAIRRFLDETATTSSESPGERLGEPASRPGNRPAVR